MKGEDMDIEIKELRKALDGLKESESKIRIAFKKLDDGSEYADSILIGLNILEQVIRDYLEAWIEEYDEAYIADKSKLEHWKSWAMK